MAQEQLTLTKIGQFVAEATRPDGSIVRFSRTNSTWYEYSIPSRKAGDQFMAEVVISNQGNPMVERLTADKYADVMKLELKQLEKALLIKQLTSL